MEKDESMGDWFRRIIPLEYKEWMDFFNTGGKIYSTSKGNFSGEEIFEQLKNDESFGGDLILSIRVWTYNDPNHLFSQTETEEAARKLISWKIRELMEKIEGVSFLFS